MSEWQVAHPLVSPLPAASSRLAAARRALREESAATDAYFRFGGPALGRAELRALVNAGNGASGVRVGGDHVDVQWPLSLAPIVLPRRVLSDIASIGALIPDAVKCSWDFLVEDHDARSFIFRSVKAEGDHFRPDLGQPVDDEPVFRLDLLFDEVGGRTKPWLIDVNLMAGMAGVTGDVQRAYSPYVDAVWGGDRYQGSFDLGGWADGVARGAQGGLTYLIRAGHALVPDAHAVIRTLTDKNVDVRLTTLDDLRWTAGELTDSSRRAVRSVFRQVRETTKHGASAVVRERERDAFGLLERAWSSGGLGMRPAFFMYLESHAWAHFWRHRGFVERLRVAVGEQSSDFLLSHVPRTARVEDERWIVDADFVRRPRRAEDVDGVALKRADSTGGAGLRLTSARATAAEAEDVEGAIARSHQDGLLLQARIPHLNRVLPVIGAEGEVEFVTGPVKVAAYFNGGRYLGAHALVHPGPGRGAGTGTALDLLPLFVPVYGEPA